VPEKTSTSDSNKRPNRNGGAISSLSLSLSLSLLPLSRSHLTLIVGWTFFCVFFGERQSIRMRLGLKLRRWFPALILFLSRFPTLIHCYSFFNIACFFHYSKHIHFFNTTGDPSRISLATPLTVADEHHRHLRLCCHGGRGVEQLGTGQLGTNGLNWGKHVTLYLGLAMHTMKDK